MEIVLYEPEIPGNTGNIARLCAANHMTLHLIKPFGFSIDDKHVKRAGLDYWHLVDVQVHENIEELYAKYPDRRYFYATTKAKHVHSDVAIIAYEAMRQLDYPDLKEVGNWISHK